MEQEQENASNFMVEQIKQSPNKIKIVSIGILSTNIGLALKNNKEIIPLINETIIMGCGSIFNINSIEDIDQVKEILEGKILFYILIIIYQEILQLQNFYLIQI